LSRSRSLAVIHSPSVASAMLYTSAKADLSILLREELLTLRLHDQPQKGQRTREPEVSSLLSCSSSRSETTDDLATIKGIAMRRGGSEHR